MFDIWTRIGGREMGEGIVRGERKSGGERNYEDCFWSGVNRGRKGEVVGV